MSESLGRIALVILVALALLLTGLYLVFQWGTSGLQDYPTYTAPRPNSAARAVAKQVAPHSLYWLGSNGGPSSRASKSPYSATARVLQNATIGGKPALLETVTFFGSGERPPASAIAASNSIVVFADRMPNGEFVWVLATKGAPVPVATERTFVANHLLTVPTS